MRKFENKVSEIGFWLHYVPLQILQLICQSVARSLNYYKRDGVDGFGQIHLYFYFSLLYIYIYIYIINSYFLRVLRVVVITAPI